jgi:hypothetical protein
MKKIFLSILTAVVFSLSGCGAGSAENASENKTSDVIFLKIGGEENSFVPSSAKFAAFKKGLMLNDSALANKNGPVEALVYRIYLANYDLKLTDPKKNEFERIGSNGQYRIEIQIEAERDAAVDAPLKTREYKHNPEPFNRVSWVMIARYKDGKDSSVILGGGRASGSLKITSVTDTEISGEVDFSDTDGHVGGKFTAQKIN